ncbi:MAG: hypothetical protein HOV81_01120, partial [Kofleriaceae bacterium]|nr:hypothetical protein [Kofleriaceae bacterium]
VAELEARMRDGRAATYWFESWPALEIVVTPSVIRDQAGRAIDVRGVEDRDEAQRLIDEENARLDAEAGDGDDEDVDDDDVDDDDDDLDDDERDADDGDRDADDMVDAESDDDDEDEDDDEDGDADDADDDDEEEDEEEDEDDAFSAAADDDDEGDDDDRPPEPAQVRAALAMTERALSIAPDDDDTQFTHAMLVLDADRVGIAGKLDELFADLPRYTTSNRVNIAVRMGRAGHRRFAEALDIALAGAMPERIIGETSSEFVAAYGDVGEELFGELGDAILEHAPDRLGKLVPLLPPNVNLLSTLAFKAIKAKQGEQALALYERLLDLPIPDDGDERTNYLRALNNACVQAHAAKEYDVAVRIADRAQPVAHENPYIYHSAACAYAAVGNYNRAFEQVKLAVAHDYDHLGKVEVDTDLGPILEWPEFKALFRDWHTRQEGN